MKLLVIGNGEQLEDTVDFFSELNFGVVGKSLEHDDVSGITKTIVDSLEKGYGLIVAYVNDGIGAGIFLNRDKKIRAAPCSTDLDIELAKKNNVNVILLSTEADIDLNILKPLKNINNGKVVEADVKKDREGSRNVIKRSETREPVTYKEDKKSLKQEEINEEKPEQVNKNKKGFFSNIKDSLGIVDE